MKSSVHSARRLLTMASGVLFIILISATTFADDTQPLPSPSQAWTCALEGEMSGIGVSFIFGGQLISGDGVLSCTSSTGEVYREAVDLGLISGGVGFDFTIIRSMHVRSVAIGVASNPEDVFGEYQVGATAGATLLNQGINFDAAILLSNARGLNFEVAMIGRDVIGIGVRLHGMVFKIDRD